MGDPGPLLGRLIELEVGPVAHGGFCIARHGPADRARVIFVRHALPGERVRALVTEDRGGSFARAGAVEILQTAPGRVGPPCPHAGPGRCGGCDWQHADRSTQLELKRSVVLEQFRRLAGLDVADRLAAVEELPEVPGRAGPGLGWRSRITFAVDPAGRPGLHRHRSHEVEPVPTCPLGVAGVGDAAALDTQWPGRTGVEVVRGDDGRLSVLEHRPGPGRQARGRRPPDRTSVVDGPARVVHDVGPRRFETAAGGFWQVHPAAAETFLAALLTAVAPKPGESVLDLYCGAGALTAGLARAVGPTGRVLGLEGDRTAVADAQANLADLPQAEVVAGRVEPARLRGLEGRFDVVVLDPPRAGAGREVMTAVTELARRAVGYVACDPAALARDVRAALDAGWVLRGLRAFDAFPMTHHVECVALLEPGRDR